jgi:hypothetical protein
MSLSVRIRSPHSRGGRQEILSGRFDAANVNAGYAFTDKISSADFGYTRHLVQVGVQGEW